MLEIGTYHGGTLYHWLQNATEGAVIVSVDSYAVGVDNRHLYADWTPPGVTLHVLAGDSRDQEITDAVQRRGPYEFVFIDAGHDYPDVRSDWETYSMMAPGGLVCFHDITSLTGVPQLWQEIKDQGYETSEILGPHQPGSPEWGLMPDTPWGGIGLVFLP